MDEDRRGGFGQFLGAFANAMLERSLPAIRAWLQARLGPGARLDRIEVEGSRLHLFDASVPIGALVLRVHKATLLTTAEELVSGRAPVRLERLEGELVATTDGAPTFTAPLELVGRPGATDAWIDADVTVSGARWTLAHGVGDAAPMDGTARVRIGTDAWRIDDAAFVSGASSVRLSARGKLGGDGALREARIDADRARAGHFLDAIAAWTGRPLRSRLPIPWHAQLDGAVIVEDGVATVELALSTEESAVEVRGRVTQSGELRDATLRGSVGWEDLGSAGRAFGGSAPIDVDVSAEGAARRPDGHASLRCAELVVDRIGALGAARVDGRLTDGSLALDGALTRGGATVATLSGTGSLPASAPGADRSSADAIALDGVLTITPDAVDGPLSLDGPPLDVVVGLRGRRLELTCRTDALSIRRDGPALSLRRIRARAELGGPDALLRVDARVGPGALLLARDARPEAARAGPTPATKIVAQRIDAASTVALASIVSPRSPIAPGGPLTWPDDAELWADLALEGGVLEGRAHVETGRSRVSFVPLRADRDGLEGTEAVGTIAFAELLDAGLFGGRLAPQPVGTFDAVARIRGRGDGTALEATLTAASVGWTWDAATSVGVVVLRDARAELAMRRGAFEVRSLTGSLFGGALSAAGSIRRDGDRRITRLDHLRAVGCADGLRGWVLGDRATHPGLEGLRADVELSIDGDRVEGEARVRTDASELSLSLSSSGGRWEASSGLRGTLSTRDLAPWASGFARRSDDGIGGGAIGDARWRVEGALDGTARRPRLSLRADADAQPISIAGARLELVGPRLEAALDGAGIRWTAFDARLLDGTLRSRGVIGLGAGSGRSFGGAVAEVVLSGVRLDAFEAARETIGGTLEGTVQLWQAARHPAGGRVQLTVEGPRYPLLARLAERLERFALPAPPVEGDAPLIAALRLDRHAVHLETLTASVPGVRLSASGHASRAGRLDATAEIVAAAWWLKKSPRLRPLVRAIGSLTVPIRLGGTMSRPALRVDVLGAIDRLIAKSELGRGLQRAIDRMLEDVEPQRGGPPRHHAPTGLSSTDTLVDRVAADAEDAPEALGALMERGLTPAEIADRVTARRQR